MAEKKTSILKCTAELVVVNSPGHHEHLVDGLWNFFNTKHKVDFDVQWADRTVCAHQLILDVFLPPGSLYKTRVMQDKRSNLDTLVEFIYNGKVAIRRDELDDLLWVANELGFKILADAIDSAKAGGNHAAQPMAGGRETRKRMKRSVTKPALVESSDSSLPESPPASVKSYRKVKEDKSPADKKRGRESNEEWTGVGGVQASKIKTNHRLAKNLKRPPAGTVKTRRPVGRPRKKPASYDVALESRLYRQRLPLRKCTLCNYETKDRRNYGAHYGKHHPGVLVPTCPECKTTFFDQESLGRHMAKMHAIGNWTNLDIADVASSVAARLDSETAATTTTSTAAAAVPAARRRVGPNEISVSEETERRRMYLLSRPEKKCELCSYATRDKRYYAGHMKKHHPEVPIPTCQICNQAFFDDESLQTHMKKQGLMVHSEAYQQRVAQMRADREANGPSKAERLAKKLEREKLQRLSRPPIKCDHCDYATRSKSSFESHLTSHHLDEATFKCDSCGQAFMDGDSLSIHRAKFKGSCTAFHNCTLCHYQTKIKVTLYRHLYTQHGINAKGKPVHNKYKCDECDYSALLPYLLKKHVMTKHSGLKPYVCQRCSYSTRHQGSLKKHVEKVHLGLKPFICEICAHRSSSKHNLDRHRLTHTGERPFPCPSCELAFADGYTLKAHVRARHTHEKPHVCHVCSHAFSALGNLKKHLKIHDA